MAFHQQTNLSGHMGDCKDGKTATVRAMYCVGRYMHCGRIATVNEYLSIRTWI